MERVGTASGLRSETSLIPLFPFKTLFLSFLKTLFLSVASHPRPQTTQEDERAVSQVARRRKRRRGPIPPEQPLEFERVHQNKASRVKTNLGW